MNVLLTVLTSTVLQTIAGVLRCPQHRLSSAAAFHIHPSLYYLNCSLVVSDNPRKSFSDMFVVVIEGCCAFALCLIIFIQMCRTVSKQQCLMIPRQLCDPSSSRLVCFCFLNTEKLWNVQLTSREHLYHDHYCLFFRNSKLVLPLILKSRCIP